jgi:hypothetical protein
MPNWCDNTLILAGDAEELARFRTKMVNDTFQFGMFIPNPFLQENGDPKPDTENAWYGWALKHWGTKWDVNPEDVDITFDDEIMINFQTAWGPPCEFVETVSKEYPTLVFHLSYHESGGELCGYNRYSNGECVSVSQADLEREEGEPFCHFYDRFTRVADKIPNSHYAECGGYCGGEGDCDECDEYAGNSGSDDDE